MVWLHSMWSTWRTNKVLQVVRREHPKCIGSSRAAWWRLAQLARDKGENLNSRGHVASFPGTCEDGDIWLGHHQGENLNGRGGAGCDGNWQKLPPGWVLVHVLGTRNGRKPSVFHRLSGRRNEMPRTRSARSLKAKRETRPCLPQNFLLCNLPSVPPSYSFQNRRLGRGDDSASPLSLFGRESGLKILRHLFALKPSMAITRSSVLTVPQPFIVQSTKIQGTPHQSLQKGIVSCLESRLSYLCNAWFALALLCVGARLTARFVAVHC